MTGPLAPKHFHLGIPWRHPRLNLSEELGNLLSGVWSEDEGWPSGALTPSLDLSETETAVEAHMDLPGVKPEEIDIQIHGNTLTVTGERKKEEEEKDRKYHRIERRIGTFSRSMTLPCDVQESKVVAEQKDGVLTIRMPKSEEAKPRKIKVQGQS